MVRDGTLQNQYVNAFAIIVITTILPDPFHFHNFHFHVHSLNYS